MPAVGRGDERLVASATPASATTPPPRATPEGSSPNHTHASPNATTGTAYRHAAATDTSTRAHAYAHVTNPTVPFQANEFSVLAAFVAAGLGVALIPEIALGALGDGTVVRPVADVPVARRIYAATRRGGLERPAPAALVAALSDAAGATARLPLDAGLTRGGLGAAAQTSTRSGR